jgi:hypothetical protein
VVVVTATSTSTATTTTSNDVTATTTTIPLEAAAAVPTKTWYNYSSTTTTTSTDDEVRPRAALAHHPRVLIAQYSGYGNYEQFLEHVVPVHRAYAQDWGYDYLVYKGYDASLFPSIRPQCLSQAQATFDKISLLELALSTRYNNNHDHSDTSSSYSKYDYVLILDTDTLLVDWHYPLPDLLRTNHKLLAAHRVWSVDPKTTWDINAGITFWNLRHPHAQNVLSKWKELTANHPIEVLTKNDDQYFLQRTLLELMMMRHNSPPPNSNSNSHNSQDQDQEEKNNNNNLYHCCHDATNLVSATRRQFAYYDGTLIRHFKRDARSWTRNGLEQRLLRVRESLVDTCRGEERRGFWSTSSSSSLNTNTDNTNTDTDTDNNMGNNRRWRRLRSTRPTKALPALEELCREVLSSSSSSSPGRNQENSNTTKQQ